MRFSGLDALILNSVDSCNGYLEYPFKKAQEMRIQLL